MYRLKNLLLLLFALSIQAQQQSDSAAYASLEVRITEAQSNFKTNLDSALVVLDQLAPEVESFNNRDLSAYFLLAKAQSMLFTEDYREIIPLLAPNISQKDSLETASLADTYRTYGEVYRQLWIPDSALVNYIKALRLFEIANDNPGKSRTYLGLGMVYFKLENEPMATDFFNRSMEYSDKSELMKAHKEGITEQPVRPVSLDKTLQMSFDILRIAEQQNNARMASVALADIRGNYYQQGDLDNALKYAELELESRRKTASRSLMAKNLYIIGDIYMQKQNPNAAIKNFNEALPEANDSLRLSLYNQMKKAYQMKGQFAAALEYSDAYLNLKDSLDEIRSQEILAETMTRFQTEIQQEQIKSLSFENELSQARISNQRATLYGTIGAAILLFFLVFLGYKNYRSNQQLKQSQLNAKLLRSQMNPHFMFNALNEIKLNLNKADSQVTQGHLETYSRLMRLVLESSTKEFVSLKDEVELITRYLQLQRLVSGRSFDFQIEVDDDLDLNYLQIPPMLTQPFVENAIIHGVKNIPEAEIKVSYCLKEEEVQIQITDNGKGFDVNAPKQKEGKTSVALANVNERIRAYKNLHNFNLQLLLESKPDKGTSVNLKFQQYIG